MTGNAHKNDPVWDAALDWLLRLQAARGDATLRRAHEAWLAASPRHAEAYRRAEKVWQLTGELPAATRWAAPRRPWRGRAIGLAAAGLLAACLALFFGPAALVRLQADHRTAVGEVKAVGLTDGSVIDLDTASAVAVDYQPPRRAVDLLAGQAFFQVASDPRPFTVRAGEAAITVTGTAFDVRLSGERVEVAVQSGSVAVAVERQPELRLGPGDRLRIDRASGAVSRDRVVPSQIAAWRRGRLIADGATVAEVTAELGRYSPGLVLLRDLELGQRRVTGIYDLRDPAAALRAAVQPHGGRVTRLAGYLLLVEAAAE